MKLTDAIRNYEQSDKEGVMVLVSRQACDEAAVKIAELQRDIDQLRRTFGHYHVSGVQDDACAECGLDLRNPIHHHMPPNAENQR